MALNTKGKKTSLTEEASIYQKRQDDLSDKERIKNMTRQHPDRIQWSIYRLFEDEL